MCVCVCACKGLGGCGCRDHGSVSIIFYLVAFHVLLFLVAPFIVPDRMGLCLGVVWLACVCVCVCFCGNPSEVVRRRCVGRDSGLCVVCACFVRVGGVWIISRF